MASAGQLGADATARKKPDLAKPFDITLFVDPELRPMVPQLSLLTSEVLEQKQPGEVPQGLSGFCCAAHGQPGLV